jgi:hypothetical protein
MTLRLAAFTALLCVSLLGGGIAGAADMISVDDLHNLKEKWPLLINNSTELKVELHVKLFGPRLLTVLRSDLQYRAEEPLSKGVGTNRYEAVGMLRKEANTDKAYFLIREIKPLPSDMEILKEKRRKIMTTRVADWYEVAQWADEKGRLYDDLDLLAEAKALYQKGVETEYGQLSPHDARSVMGLVAKVDQWKLDLDLRERLVHDAFRTEFDAVSRNPKGDFTDLMTRISRDLPGSAVPLTEEEAPAVEKYRENPMEAYKSAKAAVRSRFHRTLYVDVYKARVLREADPGGRNGQEAADRLEQIAELAALGKEYREKGIQYRLAKVTTMPRQEMLEFSKYLAERMDERAPEVKRSWLKAREPRLKKEGVNGLLSLGDESLALLEDKEAAVGWFKEADKLSPNLGLVADRFKMLSYVKHEGRWIPESEVPPPSADPFYEAVQDGRVEVGMSPRHVRAALGSAPDELIRSISGAGVKEWWTYRNDGIAVELVSTRNAPPKVTKIRSTKAAAPAPEPAEKKPVPVPGP